MRAWHGRCIELQYVKPRSRSQWDGTEAWALGVARVKVLHLIVVDELPRLWLFIDVAGNEFGKVRGPFGNGLLDLRDARRARICSLRRAQLSRGRSLPHDRAVDDNGMMRFYIATHIAGQH